MPCLTALLLQARAVAFVGVSVLRSDTAALRPNQTVVVEGERITWVGPAPEARIPADAVRIAGRGATLLPGFADMHVHFGGRTDLLTYLANGITTVRNMYGTPVTLALRDSVRTGAIDGPRIVTAGPILDGDPPSQPDMTVLVDPARARAEVTRQLDAGYDFIKVYNSLPLAVYDTILAVARERHAVVAGHVPFSAGLDGVLRGGQRSIEHLRGYINEIVPASAPVQPGASLKSRSLAWDYVDTSRFARVADATARAGVWNVPTLVVTGELLAPPERWAAMDRRAFFRVLGPAARFDRSQVPWLRDFTPEDYRAVQRGIGMQRRLVAALHRAGAPLLAGTDTNLQGYALHAELAELRAAGLSPWDVLMIATVNAARYLGEEGAWGEVKVGQRADLQLVEGNPLRSLDALHARRGVMVRGAWKSRRALDAALARAAGSTPTTR